MDSLIEGYKRFRAQGWVERREQFEWLAEDGQKPKTLIIACVDSRVDPVLIFDAEPGEILTVRNVANIVPPYEPDSSCHGTSAALEFGVCVLNVTDIVVLGHEMCGGVHALLDGAPENARDFVMPWMSIAASAREKSYSCIDLAQRQRRCEEEVVKTSLTNLLTFPWIASRVAEGKLALHGMWFAIHAGTLMLLDPNGDFVPLDDEPASHDEAANSNFVRRRAMR